MIGTVRLFHVTDAAEAVLRDGFRDGTGSYLTAVEFSGVFLSDRQLDANEGAFGSQLLEVTMPDSLDLSD